MAFTRNVDVKAGQEFESKVGQKPLLPDGPYKAIRDTGEKDEELWPVWEFMDRNGTKHEITLYWFLSDKDYPLVET